MRASGVFRNHNVLHAETLGKVHPGVDIRWVLDGGGENFVAGVPIKAVGDEGESFGGIFDKGDLDRFGVNEPGDGSRGRARPACTICR